MEDTHFFLWFVGPRRARSRFAGFHFTLRYRKDPSRVRVLQRMWRLAEDVLSKAETLVVLGYSLPDADVLVRRLFRRTIQYSKALGSVTLVLGTDDESFRRWEALLGDRAHERDRRKFEQWVRNVRQT